MDLHAMSSKGFSTRTKELEKTLKEIIHEQQETLFPVRLGQWIFREASTSGQLPLSNLTSLLAGKRLMLHTGSFSWDFQASMAGKLIGMFVCQVFSPKAPCAIAMLCTPMFRRFSCCTLLWNFVQAVCHDNVGEGTGREKRVAKTTLGGDNFWEKNLTKSFIKNSTFFKAEMVQCLTHLVARTFGCDLLVLSSIWGKENEMSSRRWTCQSYRSCGHRPTQTKHRQSTGAKKGMDANRTTTRIPCFRFVSWQQQWILVLTRHDGIPNSDELQ